MYSFIRFNFIQKINQQKQDIYIYTGGVETMTNWNS